MKFEQAFEQVTHAEFGGFMQSKAAAVCIGKRDGLFLGAPYRIPLIDGGSVSRFESPTQADLDADDWAVQLAVAPEDVVRASWEKYFHDAQQKFRAELQDLDLKISGLSEYLQNTDLRLALGEWMSLLDRKLCVMQEYSKILHEELSEHIDCDMETRKARYERTKASLFATREPDDMTQFLEQTDFDAAEKVASDTVANQRELPAGEDDCEGCKI